MKKLQNDFTTPEQSKRLLELGVPADSANCYYDGRKILRVRSEDWMLKPYFFKEYSYFNPCWSVGRLIVIYAICTGVEYIGLPTDDDFIDTMMIAIERDDLNLSKLED